MGCWDGLDPIKIRQFSRGVEKTIVAKPGVADRFFRSQQKWSKYYERGKVTGCASGKPPSGGAAGAPQSP